MRSNLYPLVICIFRLVISIIIHNVLAAPSVVKCLVKEKRCTCKVCYKCFLVTVFHRRFDFLVVASQLTFSPKPLYMAVITLLQ